MQVSSTGRFGRLRVGRLKELPAVRLEVSLSQGFARLRRFSSPGSCERGFAGGFNAFAGDKRSPADRNRSPISALDSSAEKTSLERDGSALGRLTVYPVASVLPDQGFRYRRNRRAT
jgi:hypothetical protein